MAFLGNLFSESNFIYWVELLSIGAMLLLLGYVLYVLNVFKKD
jgi:hypothetical protein